MNTSKWMNKIKQLDYRYLECILISIVSTIFLLMTKGMDSYLRYSVLFIIIVTLLIVSSYSFEKYKKMYFLKKKQTEIDEALQAIQKKYDGKYGYNISKITDTFFIIDFKEQYVKLSYLKSTNEDFKINGVQLSLMNFILDESELPEYEAWKRDRKIESLIKNN